MNRERRKALGKVFFDVAKFLLTTTAAGSFVVKDAALPFALCTLHFPED